MFGLQRVDARGQREVAQGSQGHEQVIVLVGVVQRCGQREVPQHGLRGFARLFIHTLLTHMRLQPLGQRGEAHHFFVAGAQQGHRVVDARRHGLGRTRPDRR